ncbi:MAG: hypothetical protein ACI32C_00300 [Candidatus Enteromonas sp.]
MIDEYPYLKEFEDGRMVDSLFQSLIDNDLRNIRLFVSGSHLGMMRDLLKEKTPSSDASIWSLTSKILIIMSPRPFILGKRLTRKSVFMPCSGVLLSSTSN